MATNQTAKRQALAGRMIGQTVALTDALTALGAAATEYSKAGLAFVDADFAGIAGFAHVDAAAMTNLITSVTAIQGFITANFHDTNLDKVRP